MFESTIEINDDRVTISDVTRYVILISHHNLKESGNHAARIDTEMPDFYIMVYIDGRLSWSIDELFGYAPFGQIVYG